MTKHVIIAVTNDLVTDQRVKRVAETLQQNGYSVSLVGRKLPYSLPVNRPYHTHRFRLWFNKGALFYACYNMRLLWFLLWNRFDVVLANDLDTLPASFLACRLKRKPVVYDSHEYFTEVPELIDRKFQQNTWRLLERMMVPKIKHAYTVSEGIAKVYNELYNGNFKVIRNLPNYHSESGIKKATVSIIIYQGALNVGRGIELMIQSMQYVPDAELHIVGIGDIEEKLKQLVKNEGLQEKVRFLGRIDPKDLYKITSQASVGLSLEENRGLNYYFALPNKLFDYIQGRVPVIVSNLPEMRSIVENYRVGEVLLERTPEKLAGLVNKMIENSEKEQMYHEQLDKAARELNWQVEEKKLLKIFNPQQNTES